jgi:hypothetical protein
MALNQELLKDLLPVPGFSPGHVERTGMNVSVNLLQLKNIKA